MSLLHYYMLLQLNIKLSLCCLLLCHPHRSSVVTTHPGHPLPLVPPGPPLPFAWLFPSASTRAAASFSSPQT